MGGPSQRFRQLAELRRVLPRLHRDIRHLLFRVGLLVLGGIGLDGNENVRRLPLLGLAIKPRIVVVLLPDLGGIERDLRAERIRRQRHVLELHFFGHLERGRICVVESFYRRVVDLDLLEEGIGVERGHRGFALLFQQAEIALGVGPGDDVPADDRFLHGSQHELPPDFPRELNRRLRRVLHREQLFVARLGKFAVLLKRGNLGNELPELVVGHAELAPPRLFLQEFLADQSVEERISHLGIIEHCGIEIPAERLAHALLLLAQRIVEFGLTDRRTRDPGHLAGPVSGATKVVIDTEESERQTNQRENALD